MSKIYEFLKTNKGSYKSSEIAEQTSIDKKEVDKEIKILVKEGKLHFIAYFRSWDLWNGFPANLGAIQHLKEYMASSIGVEDGEIIASSKGLHIYDYVWELAKLRTMKAGLKDRDKECV